ncbi:hypothetical protein AVEN_28561-1 [Araneus ventricosus]|uniref:Uncharacterized protein n=1 Tax=Araneus ventricosus TaxID=182803 RepID=A0A4Y2L7P3_ARAVE|nr:hypothetical protein AVEN_28561-1 [Araneus ventricosus]
MFLVICVSKIKFAFIHPNRKGVFRLKAGHSPSIYSNPFGDFPSIWRARPFPFSAPKTWWDFHRSDCTSRTCGQLSPLRYCASLLSKRAPTLISPE